MITREEIHDTILVRLIDVESEFEYPIRTYWTSSFEETLKMYRFIQKEYIDICIKNTDYDNNDKYTNMLATIEDIEVGFGSRINFTTIDLYVKLRDYK